MVISVIFRRFDRTARRAAADYSALVHAAHELPKEAEEARPEVDQINFAPRVTIPTLILDGRDDFVFPRELSQEPFYRLLGTPREHKRRLEFEGGHSVPRPHLIRESLDWLDRYLGPVQRPWQ
jgi:hypothetical protein